MRQLALVDSDDAVEGDIGMGPEHFVGITLRSDWTGSPEGMDE